MSIISSYEVDNSAALAKRFAALAASYFDDPVRAKDRSAQVALENVYRLLEMFRYDSFADESRRGVLALEGLDAALEGPLGTGTWHDSITGALERSLTQTYGNNVQKENAIDQIQGCLRSLVKGEVSPTDATQRAKGFLQAFGALV